MRTLTADTIDIDGIRFPSIRLRDNEAELHADRPIIEVDARRNVRGRLLHARTAFTSSGERHLQGAYADLDSLESTLFVLRRELQTV